MGISIHFQEVVFHAEELSHVVEKRADEPYECAFVAVLAAPLDEVVKDKVVGIRPMVLFNFPDRFNLRKKAFRR